MSKGHKDLPTGSQPWAAEVDAAMKKVAELEAIVRRLTENAGIDMSNPKRGINTGNTPSIKSPVSQKLSSLADVDTYNVLQGQVLGWSQAGQKWLPIDPPTTGATWVLATEEEHMWGDFDNDSDYYSTQVMGLHDSYPPGVDYTTGGTGDGYGLVGTSTSSAFLHGAQRFGGGPTKAHGYVVAEPYYCKMGVVWIDDTGSTWGNDKGYDPWGEVHIDRESIFISTPIGEVSTSNSLNGQLQRDGAVSFLTNWFYVPQVNSGSLPKRPVPLTGRTASAGAMAYDVTLQKPIFWDGAKWVDAMGNDIPAPLY